MGEAIARGLEQIAEWVASGLNERTRPLWEGIPDCDGLLAGISAEQLAEAHTRLLVLEVPAYESVYRSADGLLGGDISAAVAGLRLRSGLSPVGENTDHLAHELGLLAFLVGAISDAKRDGVSHAHILELERSLLDEHLLRWLPAWVAALASAAEVPGFFLHVSRLMLDLVLLERQHLLGEPSRWELPLRVEVLENPRAGLVDIAEHLALASQAGGYFPRSALVRIGRLLDIPAGFGSRADTLEGLFRNAAHYQLVPQLCAALEAEAAGWESYWAGVPPQVCGPWLMRISDTRALLRRVAAATPNERTNNAQ